MGEARVASLTDASELVQGQELYDTLTKQRSPLINELKLHNEALWCKDRPQSCDEECTDNCSPTVTQIHRDMRKLEELKTANAFRRGLERRLTKRKSELELLRELQDRDNIDASMEDLENKIAALTKQI